MLQLAAIQLLCGQVGALLFAEAMGLFVIECDLSLKEIKQLLVAFLELFAAGVSRWDCQGRKNNLSPSKTVAVLGQSYPCSAKSILFDVQVSFRSYANLWLFLGACRLIVGVLRAQLRSKSLF